MRLVRICTGLAALAAAALPVHATTYTPGEFVTFEARVWGAAPDGANAATFLFNNFDAAFPQLPAESILSGDHYLAVGVPESDDLLGPHGLFGLSEPDPPFSMVLDSAFGVNYYLETATGVAADHDAPLGPPAQLPYDVFNPGGAPAAFSTTGLDLSDPRSAPGGILGADAVALTLNVDFSDANLLAHPAGVTFGDLVFQNLDSLVGQSVTLPDGDFGLSFVLGADVALLDGFSVRDVLTEADLKLSSEKSFASQFDPADLDYILFLADTAFNEGLLNLGAQYLAFPPSAGDGGAPAVPEPSTWAMLLIGFAGLSLAGWRASRRGGVAASRCVRQEPLTA